MEHPLDYTPPPSKFSRLARIGRLTSKVGGSYLGQRVKGVFQKDEDRARDTRKMQVEGAQRVAKAMGQLKGAAMKVGQQMAQVVDGMDLPPEVGVALRQLNDKAEQVPFAVIREEIERQLDGPVTQHFASIDPAPLGTASLAQAHAATLHDGRQVVIKVLHQGIESSVDTDLSALRRILISGRLLNRPKAEIDTIFEEVRARLMEELDYYQEAANLEFFADAFQDDPDICVPRSHPSLCTGRVLTMDRLSGVPLDDFLKTASPQAKQRAAMTLAHSFFRMTYELQALHADPHEGNYLFMPDGQVGILDFGCVKRFNEFWIADYARVADASISGDKALAMEATIKMGVITEASPAAEDLVWSFSQAIAEPFAGVYKLGAIPDPVAEKMRALGPKFLRHPEIQTPQDVLYLHRALGGLYSILCRLEAEADWGAMLRPWHKVAIDRAEGRR
ncbi:MAG: putative unusual protein kinase regulating ubiquinone biosynthesis (AarF/ABC1/UbiB family) [Cognaticolwellia sp.]